MKKDLKWSIAKRFSDSIFTRREAMGAFPEIHPKKMSRILTDMVRAGILGRLTRDKYHVIPWGGEVYPAYHRIVLSLMGERAYFVGYSKAMEIHGLIAAGGSVVHVVTGANFRPRTYGAVSFVFLRKSAEAMFGVRELWVHKDEKTMVSDVEKTVVDACTRPQLCGGIVPVAQALVRALPRCDQETLFLYFARNKNKSAMKRFLYLSSLLELEWNSNHDRLLEITGNSYALLDPSGPAQGIRKFGLRINIDADQLRHEVLEGTKKAASNGSL